MRKIERIAHIHPTYFDARSFLGRAGPFGLTACETSPHMMEVELLGSNTVKLDAMSMARGLIGQARKLGSAAASAKHQPRGVPGLPEDLETGERIIDDHGHILVVDDDPQIRLLVARFLQRQGYRVTTVQDGLGMREALGSSTIDLVVLDVMLPGRSGFDLCKDIRATSSVPIIMLTARSDETDRVIGLEMGADDYVSKPFGPRELLARIRAVLRRVRTRSDQGPNNEATTKEFDGWRLDLRRRELTSPANVLVDLSTGEFDLLLAFVEHPNRVLSREILMELAKTRSVDPFDRTIDVQISRLRRKLGSDENGGQLIKTIRGAGYMFASRVESTT